MLYVTTRNNRDAYTAQRVLRENRGPDGGLYVPFRAPGFTREEILSLGGKSFNQCVADVLNRLFNTRLTAWDVEFAAGRCPVRLSNLPQKTILAECRHNPEGTFFATVRALTDALRGGKPGTDDGWGKVAVGIAVLFGIFGELIRDGIADFENIVDISLVSGDFDLPMSAWYARKWGLPIGSIVCCCNENGNLWEFLHHGQLRTDAVSVKTDTPDADVTVPAGLERLIFACGGIREVDHYLEVCRRGGVYCPSDVLLSRLREGMEVSVVGARRTETTVSTLFHACGCVLSPYSALAWAGVQDFRTMTGVSRHALVLEEKSPALDSEAVAGALGVSADALNRYL